MDLNDLFDTIADWARAHGGVLAVCLVGSHARGEGGPDSDVDLVVLCTDPHSLLDDPGWRAAFGEVDRSELEDWGERTSLRTFYRDGTEIEFLIASPEWAASPVDPGTRDVVAQGMRIVYDPDGVLGRLAGAVREQAGT